MSDCVVGIGEIYLEKIKEQGLACVNEELPEKAEIEQEPELIYNNETEINQENLDMGEEQTLIQPEVIKLNAKTIKSENNNESLDKGYAKYGLVIFCVLLGLLFILKKKRFNKNEFG